MDSSGNLLSRKLIENTYSRNSLPGFISSASIQLCCWKTEENYRACVRELIVHRANRAPSAIIASGQKCSSNLCSPCHLYKWTDVVFVESWGGAHWLHYKMYCTGRKRMFQENWNIGTCWKEDCCLEGWQLCQERSGHAVDVIQLLPCTWLTRSCRDRRRQAGVNPEPDGGCLWEADPAAFILSYSCSLCLKSWAPFLSIKSFILFCHLCI